jgi:hypothetical protein
MSTSLTFAYEQDFSWISSDDATHGQTQSSDQCDASAAWGEKANRVEPWLAAQLLMIILDCIIYI